MTAAVRQWVASGLGRDVTRALARLATNPDVARIAVMPDVHLAHDVCVGVVTATTGMLFPQAVGGDIGCGISAIRFDCEAARVDDAHTAARLLEGLYRRVPQNKHGAAPGCGPAALDVEALSHEGLRKVARRDGLVQFATLGRGNHFLELQSDDEGALWAMVHSGSRAIGPAVRDWHLRAGSERGGLLGLDAASDEGMAYLADMGWALGYAAASRDAMVEALCELVAEVAGAEAVVGSRIGCHHNFVRRETHDGAALWVHRKGAISAGPGEDGIIAGSMGTASFHVRGRGCAASLRSSSHGAGRVMSRSDARRRVSMRDLRAQMAGVWFDHRLASRLRDEAPGAYKDVDAVMKAQRELTRVVRRLRPVLSYKGA